MMLDLVNYERKAGEAIKVFWGNREAARQKQHKSGKADQGERSGVTAGKNMDGFIALVIDLVRGNGLAHSKVHPISSGMICYVNDLFRSNSIRLRPSLRHHEMLRNQGSFPHCQR